MTVAQHLVHALIDIWVAVSILFVVGIAIGVAEDHVARARARRARPLHLVRVGTALPTRGAARPPQAG